MALGTGVSVAIEVVSVATAVEVLCEFVLFVAALPIAAKMKIAPKTIPRMSQGFVFFFGGLGGGGGGIIGGCCHCWGG